MLTIRQAHMESIPSIYSAFIIMETGMRGWWCRHACGLLSIWQDRIISCRHMYIKFPPPCLIIIINSKLSHPFTFPLQLLFALSYFYPLRVTVGWLCPFARQKMQPSLTSPLKIMDCSTNFKHSSYWNSKFIRYYFLKIIEWMNRSKSRIQK